MELTLQHPKPNKQNEMALRDATDRDVPALLDVMLAAFREYQQVLDPPSAAHTESVETVRRRLGRGRAVVAELQNQIVGFAFYEVHNDGLFYFSRLSVLPAFRQRGIGLALVKYIESRADEASAPGIRLGARLQLPHLVARYEKMGYRIAKYMTHDGYTQPTYVYMEKIYSRD